MALAAATVWEVRTTGADTNGGGFVTGASGSDWSQQDAARTGADVTDISVTDAVAAGTTTITSALANFATTIVGNIVYFSGGTGSIAATRRQVTARASTTSITVDASIASSTGMTLNIGGALASPGLLNTVSPTLATSGNTVYVKAGTYSLTTTNGATGGVVGGTARLTYEGYQTTRGDMGTPPLLQASGLATVVLFTTNVDGSLAKNIKVDGATLTSTRGFLLGGTTCYKCTAINCTNSGFSCDQDSTLIAGLASGCTTQPAIQLGTGGFAFGCVATANTADGFSVGRGARAVNCLSYANTGAATDGFNTATTDGATMINCTAHGNGAIGFALGGNGGGCTNCIAEGNTGVGFANSGTGGVRAYCATYNNSAATSGNGWVYEVGNVVATASVFTNAAGADFSLNNTASAGAACRAAGFPGTLPS